MVGTTGDYKPMSYLNRETGRYEGFDTEASELLAQSLGVQVKFIPTTWSTLTADTLAGKFDIGNVRYHPHFGKRTKNGAKQWLSGIW